MRAEGHGDTFCFVVTHLESPMGKVLRHWLGQQRMEQAKQVEIVLMLMEIANASGKDRACRLAGHHHFILADVLVRNVCLHHIIV